ncbi:MAG TPA: hypothetical protein VK388_08220 [Pyrinomonadaceae bacterium]|nr:hypothetical protein [Pyrinomonadaceae bacterium]
MRTRFISGFLFCIGVSLLGVNIAGFFVPLKNPDIYSGEYGYLKKRVTLTEDQLWAATLRVRNESAREYVLRLNKAVNEGIAHYWENEGAYEYNLRIPFQENYLLFLASYIYPQQYAKYEYCDYRKAIRRGVGLCSQQAIIVVGLLEAQGINHRIAHLGGHVVALAEVDEGVWWIVDADYGVVVPHALAEVESDPGIIKPIYKQKGYSDDIVEYLSGLYGREHNRVYSGIREYRFWKIYEIERLSYVLIWIIPIMMLTPYLVLRGKGWSNRRTVSAFRHYGS